MTVTANLYGPFFNSLSNKLVDLDSDVFKAMLLTSSYSPDLATHQFKSSVVANEVTGTGYTAGGATIATPTFGFSGGVFTWDAANASWGPSSTITARYLVIYDSTPGSDAARPLVALADFGANMSSSAGTFTAAFDPAGIFTITVP